MSIFKFVTFHFISINKFIGVGTNYVFLTVKIQQGFVFYRFCYFFERPYMKFFRRICVKINVVRDIIIIIDELFQIKGTAGFEHQ